RRARQAPALLRRTAVRTRRAGDREGAGPAQGMAEEARSLADRPRCLARRVGPLSEQARQASPEVGRGLLGERRPRHHLERVDRTWIDVELGRHAAVDQTPPVVEVLVEEQVEGACADVGGWEIRKVVGQCRGEPSLAFVDRLVIAAQRLPAEAVLLAGPDPLAGVAVVVGAGGAA